MVSTRSRRSLGVKAPGEERLAGAGLELRSEDGKMFIDNIVFGSVAEKQQLDFDWEIASIQQATDRPPKQLLYIPALALLFFIVILQRRRRSVAAA